MTHPDWSQGYVTDTSYTDRFFRELSPVWLNYVAALNGARPRRVDRPFTYLELGCGFGHSAIVNAGAFPSGEFHACDINPAHIEGGRRRAAAYGVGNIEFHETSFEHLRSLELPAFDFIVLHGVYSWVGAGARQAIRRIICEKLRPGGLVYVSYNCLPGWSIEAPLRRLLLELAAGERGGTEQRARRALNALTQLSSGKLRYFNANPAAVAAVEAYVKGPGNYLVHEFLNDAWEPFYSIDVADEMADADVSYLGSATLADNHEPLVVSDRAAETVATLHTARQRQLAADFAVDRRFRRDVFVRRDVHDGDSEPARRLHAAVIGCLDDPERIGTRAQVPRGAITFQEHFIRELRRLMHQGSTTIGDAVTALGGAGRDAAEIVRNLTYLVAAGTLMPFASARTQSAVATARRPGNATVARVLADAIEHRAPRAIPSETLGNGVPISPIEALAIAGWLDGADSVETLTAHVEAEATRLGLHTTGGGQPLPAGGKSVEYTRAAARRAIEDLVPSLARLGLIV